MDSINPLDCQRGVAWVAIEVVAATMAVGHRYVVGLVAKVVAHQAQGGMPVQAIGDIGIEQGIAALIDVAGGVSAALCRQACAYAPTLSRRVQAVVGVHP